MLHKIGFKKNEKKEKKKERKREEEYEGLTNDLNRLPKKSSENKAMAPVKIRTDY